jgi:hypothetical protein
MATRRKEFGLDFSGPRRNSGRAKGGFMTTLWAGLQLLILIAGIGILIAALHVQLAGTVRLALIIAVLAIGTAIVTLHLSGQTRPAWIAFAALTLISLGWWLTIRPSGTRLWAADVEHGVTATFGAGDKVTLSNIRNFDWTSRDTATPHWETRTYDLSQLISVDVITSAWSSPAIAHMLLSFGFEGGQHIVFSAEIRREHGEAFSILGGFFKQFELVLIAADEHDIIRLRTDFRGEAVSIFPLTLPQATMQHAFRSFATLGNDLAAHPRFYNTVISNCTTVPWRLAREIAPSLPLDWRVVLSGHFPAYMRDLGVTGKGKSLQDMLAWARLRGPTPTDADGPAYSAHLRDRINPSP